jgi:hypothetical protein
MSQLDTTVEMFQFAMARAHFDVDAIVRHFNRSAQKLAEDADKLREIRNRLVDVSNRSTGELNEGVENVLELIDLEAFDALIDALSVKNSPVLEALAKASKDLEVLAKPSRNLDGSMATKISAFAG